MWQIPHCLRASPLFRNVCKQVLVKNANCSILLQKGKKKKVTPRIYNPPGSLMLKISSYQVYAVVFVCFLLETEDKLQQ